MPDAFLILHGLENHRTPQHWHFLLAAQLVEDGQEVRYPGLPDPDAPRLDAWLATLDRELGELEGRRRTVVCHSLGCMLWMRAAAVWQRPVADRVLLVAPPAAEQVPPTAESFFRDELDPGAVRASAREELAIVCSDADPYNHAGAQARYGDPLGIEATVIPGAGHFNPDSGHGPWPLPVEWCLSPGRS